MPDGQACNLLTSNSWTRHRSSWITASWRKPSKRRSSSKVLDASANRWEGKRRGWKCQVPLWNMRGGCCLGPPLVSAAWANAAILGIWAPFGLSTAASAKARVREAPDRERLKQGGVLGNRQRRRATTEASKATCGVTHTHTHAHSLGPRSDLVRLAGKRSRTNTPHSPESDYIVYCPKTGENQRAPGTRTVHCPKCPAAKIMLSPPCLSASQGHCGKQVPGLDPPAKGPTQQGFPYD